MLEKLKRTETLFTIYVLVSSTVLNWFGKLDGMAWVAAVTLVSSTYVAARSYVKGKESDPGVVQ